MATLYLGGTPLIDMSAYALQSNTYTKSEVDSAIENVDVSDQLDDYVKKETGKGLSTNDYDADAKSAVDSLSTTYVAKDGDKVLSDNNFTTALKEKLDGLSNFDPTDINSAISALQETLGDITGDGKDVTEALDTWAEIKAFIADYKSTDSIASLLSTLESNIHTWVEGKGYLTAVPEDYKTKTENDELYQAKGNYVTYNESTHKVTFNDSNSYYNSGSWISLLESPSKTEDGKTHQLQFNASTGEIKFSKFEGAGENLEEDTFAKVSQIPTDYLTDADIEGLAKTSDIESTYETKSDAANHINGSGVTNIIKISNADYEALGTKDSATLYIVG